MELEQRTHRPVDRSRIEVGIGGRSAQEEERERGAHVVGEGERAQRQGSENYGPIFGLKVSSSFWGTTHAYPILIVRTLLRVRQDDSIRP
jgi:hypothetical protein